MASVLAPKHETIAITAIENGSSHHVIDWHGLFHGRILPRLGVEEGNVDSPILMFVCGQQGSGKTTLRHRLSEELGVNRTQQLSGDSIIAALPELFMDREDGSVADLLRDFKRVTLPNYYTLLLDHAIRLRANVVWELAKPFDMRALTSLARSFGYRVEALVLATPLMESWISTLKRETLRALDPDKVPVRVSLEKITSCFARWPSHLAWAEDLHVFDKVQVINRQGEVFFENRLIEDKGKLRWSETPFAFESLVLERLHACSRDQVDCLISEWQMLRADPDIALQNHLAWPWSSITDTGSRLLELRDDPSTSFNLLNPDQSVNIDARKGWIARLQEDLIAIQLSVEDEGAITLGPRCERLLTLVNSV